MSKPLLLSAIMPDRYPPADGKKNDKDDGPKLAHMFYLLVRLLKRF
jgi:hypothetical protein